MRTPVLISVALPALLASEAAAAQATVPGDHAPAAPAQATRTTIYDAAFFRQYAPRTALDIAQRVPGFTLDLGNTDVRGFAQAAGNVVINGARPSSKADTLETTLSRIPANRVVRVEVGPGDLYGAEYSGKSQVLNVILSAEAGVDGNVTASGRRIYTGKVVPNLSGSALIKRGASSFNLSAGTQRFGQVEEGSDTLFEAGDGEQLEFRRKINRFEDRSPFVSGSWALERASDNAVRVNARFSPGSFYLVQDNIVVPAEGLPRRDDLVQDFTNRVFELGGDVTRPLAGGAIKLVGLATRRSRDNRETYRFRRDDVTLGGFEQLQDAQRNETIARVTWSRGDLAGFSFETGAEGVLNTLDSQVDLFILESGGGRTRIDLPIDNARVTEKRGEISVNAGRNLGDRLRLDGGLTYEMSHLTVSGDTSAERTLRFLKPQLTLDWKGGSGWHGQLSIKRRVAQLDFFDFISAAELATDRVNAGNANLVPQRSWEFRATLDKRILGEGLVKLDVGHDLISLLQDRVLTEEGFDAPGNIGSGRRSFARLTLDAPLSRLGLRGLRAKWNGQLQRTRVEDPVTGEMRGFSGFYPGWEWNLEVRRDADAFSYGFQVADRDRFTFFRTDEIDSNRNAGPYATAFVEYRPNPRTTITLDADNALDTQAFRERIRYFPNRTAAEPGIREIRERNRHVALRLAVKRSFGSGGVARGNGGS
jgi:hypothetical protein